MKNSIIKNSKILTTAKSLLGRELTDKDGMSETKIEGIEKLLGIALPSALRDFYLLVGETPMFMSSFEQFIKPFVKNNMLVFLEENQGVCYWGVNIQDAGKNNVFQCPDAEAESPGWTSEGKTLKDFLIMLMLYQCAQGGYEYGGAVYRDGFDSWEEYSEFLLKITEGYIKAAEHNGLVIYQSGTKLIWHFTDKDGIPEDMVFASVLTEEGMREFDEYGFAEL